MIIKVMPDFCSTGLWEIDTKGDEITMLEFDEIAMPNELIEDFKLWIEFYDSSFDKDYNFFKKGKAKKVNDMGMNLAKRLKNELPYTEIVFWAETTDNGKFEITKHKID